MRPVIDLLVAAALGLAGCADREPTVHHVEIRGMQYVPADLTAAVGDVIEWTNVDVFPHTATAAGVFDSASIAPRASWRHTVTTAGAFTYVCTFHPTMSARVTVRRR